VDPVGARPLGRSLKLGVPAKAQILDKRGSLMARHKAFELFVLQAVRTRPRPRLIDPGGAFL
jgi:hypothetical protein